MDLSKLVEHVRTTHFAIIVVSVTVLIFAQAEQSSKPYEAYNELLIVERLSQDWKRNDLEALAISAYADHHGELPRSRVFGTVTLFPEEAGTEMNGLFRDAAGELGYPISEEFSASAVSLLSDSLLVSWKKLSQETLSSDHYGPPGIRAAEEIEEGPYFYTPHSAVAFDRPSSLRGFSDFWNVLALDHSLQTLEPSPSDTSGAFSMTKNVMFAFGNADVQFHSKRCGLDDIDDEPASDCLWMFAGGLQDRREAYENFREQVKAHVSDPADIADFGFHVEGDVLRYLDQLETRSSMVLHLSLHKNFIAMATMGEGWMDAWDGTSSAKDFSVQTKVLIPAQAKSTPFDAQSLVLARLPLGILDRNPVVLGSFEESFPALVAYHEQYGATPFDELKTLIRQQLEQGKNNTTVSLFGLTIPIGFLSLFGGAFVFFTQTYHYLHLKQLFSRIDFARTDTAVWGVPWVGLYLDSTLAKITVVLTAVILPSGAVVYTTASLAFNGSWIALVILPVLLMSVMTLITYSQVWRRPR
ncbi:hypothetical protein [Roseibium sp.]|uniref:hypothetical protein n=1 Tax=Roseibium sp. TaxID=1936156 RepID=UPI003BAEF02C